MPAYTDGDLVDHVAVALAIPSGEGTYLTLDHAKFGWWTIPLGKCEPEQSLGECVAMELREELGVQVSEFSMLSFRRFDYVRKGLPVRVELHLLEVSGFDGQPTNMERIKHRDLKWSTIDELFRLSRTSDGTLMLLEYSGFSISSARWSGTPIEE